MRGRDGGASTAVSAWRRQPEGYRSALASSLVAVTGQTLLKRADRPGRVAAFDWIEVDEGVRSIIREGDLSKLVGLASLRTRRDAVQSLLEQKIIDEAEATPALREG